MKLKAIAITDHDNVRSAMLINGDEPIETIAGVELSVFDKNAGYVDIHILGLFIDPKKISGRLEELEREREKQKMATVEKLQSLGYSITFDEVKKKAKGAVGRPHIAKVLLEKYPNDFSSIADVFSKLLGTGKKAYVEREVGFALEEAVSLIRKAGGLSFIAHPLLYPYDAEKLLSDFKKLGGDGVETYYDYIVNRPQVKITREENMDMYRKVHALASELSLLKSGGSDFHGETKGQTLGKFGVPDRILEDLKAARKHL